MMWDTLCDLVMYCHRREQCMMSLMVDLIILVICISDRVSDMKKTGTGSTSSGGDEGM